MNAISDSFIQKYDHFSKRNLGGVVFLYYMKILILIYDIADWKLARLMVYAEKLGVEKKARRVIGVWL